MKYFEDNEISFIKEDDKLWITSSAIALGLDIDRTNINQIYHNNKELLEPYTCVMKIITKGQHREVRVFDKIGLIGICIRSNSPKALPFQQFVLEVIEEIEEKGFYIKKATDPYELLVKQADMIKKAFIDLKEQNQKLKLIESKVDGVDKELKTFEQKYDDEKIITPQTKRVIKDIVHNTVKITGLHWGHYWPKIWKAFNITTTEGISETSGQRIVKWLKLHPSFHCEGLNIDDLMNKKEESQEGVKRDV